MKIHLCIIAFLMCILASCNYFSHTLNNFQQDTITQQPTVPLTKEDSLRMTVEIKYNDALARLDSLDGVGIYSRKKFPAEASSIDSIKQSIRSELNKTTSDYNKADSLINEFHKHVNNILTKIKQEKNNN